MGGSDERAVGGDGMTRAGLILATLVEGTDAWDHWWRYVGDLHPRERRNGPPTRRHGVGWWLVGTNKHVLATGSTLFPGLESARSRLMRLRAAAAEGLLEARPYIDPDGCHSFGLVGRIGGSDERPLVTIVAVAARRYGTPWERNLGVASTLRVLALEGTPTGLSPSPRFPDPRGVEPDEDGSVPTEATDAFSDPRPTPSHLRSEPL